MTAHVLKHSTSANKSLGKPKHYDITRVVHSPMRGSIHIKKSMYNTCVNILVHSL